MQPIETKLTNLGYTLPTPTKAIANYIPFVIVDNLVFISGQLPSIDGTVQHTGLITQNNIEVGEQAAKLCALNILAQLKAACDNDLNRVIRCVRLGGFVACESTFYQQSQIINPASEMMVQLWGDAGRHARAAIGCTSLPLNAMVEIEAIFAIQ